MKGKIGWIWGTIESGVGLIFFLAAQLEISSNSWYSWSQPYTRYEARIILLKWIGILLLISGITTLCLKVFQTRYTNNHTQDINQVTQSGGAVKCWNCGLSLSADVENCPRCGSIVKQKTNYVSGSDEVRFCSKCGNPVNKGELFCPKCGQQIIHE